MDKDISEIVRQWKSLNVCTPAIDKTKKMDPYFEKYFMKYSKTIYQSALSLFHALDFRNLKKSYKNETVSIQALKYFKDFVDKNQGIVDQAFWKVEVALAACQFAINRENEIWIQTICKYYGVTRVHETERICLLKKTLNEKKFSAAAWFALYAEVIREIPIEDICIPLICQSKIALVEQLMKYDSSVAKDLVKCIDSYVDNVGELTYLARDIPGANYAMLNVKGINRLAKRLAREYRIPVQFCPRIDYNAKMTAIKFLLKRRYIELKPMDKETWDSMLDTIFDQDNQTSEDRDIVLELIYDLTNYGQYEEAMRWTNLYRIPESEWPDLLLSNRSNPDKTYPSLDNRKIIYDWNPEPIETEVESYEVEFSETRITLIDTHEKFKEMNYYIIKKYPLIAIDTEWKPNLGLITENETRASLIQIACEDKIYVIDALAIQHDSEWTTFVNRIINNPTLLKIGFAIQNDIRALSGLLSDKNIVPKPESFIDYAEFHNSLVQSFKIPTPDYPVSSGGLSKLAFAVLGKYLIKDDQYTNWEIRPLTTEKILYAATDAFVLLEIHEKLESWCQERGINYEMLMYSFLDRHPMSSRNISVREPQEDLANFHFPPTSLKDFKAVADPRLSNFAVLLRFLGVDVKVPVFNSFEAIKRIVWGENRPYITIGEVNELIIDTLPHGWTFGIDNLFPLFDRLVSVIIKFNLIVTDKFIYTRCCRCNYHHLIVIDKSSIESWKENQSRLRDDVAIAYHLIPEDDDIKVFYICYACGMVYWKGKYYKLVKQWAKSLILHGFGRRNSRAPTLAPGIDKKQVIQSKFLT